MWYEIKRTGAQNVTAHQNKKVFRLSLTGKFFPLLTRINTACPALVGNEMQQ